MQEVSIKDIWQRPKYISASLSMSLRFRFSYFYVVNRWILCTKHIFNWDHGLRHWYLISTTLWLLRLCVALKCILSQTDPLDLLKFEKGQFKKKTDLKCWLPLSNIQYEILRYKFIKCRIKGDLQRYPKVFYDNVTNLLTVTDYQFFINRKKVITV